MNGAVLLIGSLLWENGDNSIDKKLGKVREEWRKNLLLDQRVSIKVPIRYGRKSSKRQCTYTMVFSNSVQELGSGFLIPFNSNAYIGNDLIKLKKQAFGLSFVEGISKITTSQELYSSWGCVGICFNPNNINDYSELRKFWMSQFTNFDNSKYKLWEEEPSVTINGELNFNLDLPLNIDYVLATSTVPNISNYPSNKLILDSILESNPRYDTYILENVRNGIRVFNDDEILKGL